VDEIETSYQQYNEDDRYIEGYESYNYEDGYEPSSYQQYNDEDQYAADSSYQYSYEGGPSTYYGPSTSYQQYNDEFERSSISTNEYNSQATSYLNHNNLPVPPVYTSGKIPRQRSSLQIHAKVEEILVKLKNGKIRDYTFKPLRTFNINKLLKYEKSDLFNSLSNEAKKSIKISINDELRDELSGKKKITQQANVYVNRKIVPPLPPGIKSYAEFAKTYQYSILSNEKKKRIQKVISKEK